MSVESLLYEAYTTRIFYLLVIMELEQVASNVIVGVLHGVMQ